MIFYNPYGGPSVRLLKRALIDIGSVNTVALRHKNYILRRQLVINWGRRECPRSTHNQVVLNNNIEFVRTKLTSKNKLITEGVPTPPLLTYEQITNDCFIRLNDGSTIYLAKEGEIQVPARSSVAYATKRIKRSVEFRVHIVGGDIVAAFKKVPNEKGSPMLKSFNSQFVKIDLTNVEGSSLTDTGREIAIRSVVALSLDFGAVDLLKDPDGNFWVLEVNTSPGLNSVTSLLYARALTKLFCKKIRGVIYDTSIDATTDRLTAERRRAERGLL
jgi:hypothetical protein